MAKIDDEVSPRSGTPGISIRDQAALDIFCAMVIANGRGPLEADMLIEAFDAADEFAMVRLSRGLPGSGGK